MTSDSKNKTPSAIYLQRFAKKAKNLLPVYLRVMLSDKKLIEEKKKEPGSTSNQELSDDKALTHPDDDEFGRAEFAKRIADILANRQTPDHLTVGIYGKWGEGKTSLVNFIKHYLDLDESVVHFDFNPWRYKDEDELLNSFFKQFAQGVTHKLGEGGKKIAKTILAYSGLIVAIAEPITGLAMFSSLEGWGSFKKRFTSSKDFVDDNNFSPVINSLESSLDKSDSLQKQKDRISRQLKETGKKYIVFIDDIDRLDKEEIQMLFSLIKVTADFDHVIYVLSFDPKIVATALGETYSESGRSFLDKIVQVPLNLPKARSTDIFNELLYPGVQDLLESFDFAITEAERGDIFSSIKSGLEKKINTPRLVKRFLNAINFALPILRKESNVHDVILVEGLRISYPDAYDFVFRNHELFISTLNYYLTEEREKSEKQQVKEFFEGNEKEKKKDESLENLLKSLFPKLVENPSESISNEELARQQRVSSPEYFERYFTYSIPKDDLSDVTFEEFLNGLETREKQESVEIANELIENSSEDLFLRKLEQRFE